VAAMDGISVPSFHRSKKAFIRAAFSSHSLSGITGAVANKSIIAGFRYTEQVWREVAKIGDVSDLKTHTRYRLNGDYEFDEIPAGGPITHGTMSEESYTVKAKTYAKMGGIDRTDIINDDKGALTERPFFLGRGAGVKLNKIFWTAFFNPSGTFFTTSDTTGLKINQIANVLGVAGLQAAEEKYSMQTDANGELIGIDPNIILVPPALIHTARQLYESMDFNETTTADTPKGKKNTYAGMYRPVKSRYLQLSDYGNSSTAWYLLGDPALLPVWEVAFLDGQDTPIIEESDVDFQYLGIQFRGYFDFGIGQRDPRGILKSTGAGS